jgi:hypothetical protein
VISGIDVENYRSDLEMDRHEFWGERKRKEKKKRGQQKASITLLIT